MRPFCVNRLLLFILFFTLSSHASFAAQDTLTIVCEDKEDYPNVVGDGEKINERLPGIAIEFVRIIGQKLGMKVIVKRLPWKRCLDIEIKQGKADGVIPISYKKEREDIGAYPFKNGKPDQSRMFSMQSYVFYKQLGSKIEWDGSSIQNFKGVAGVPPGYSVIDSIKKMGLSIEEGFALSNMHKLASGKIQLAASLEQEGDQVLLNNPDLNNKIEKITPPIITKPYYIMLSHQFVKNNPDIAKKIWDMMKELREKEYKKLARKY
jgi:polar amino acid transport system substrate-binding protein